MATLVDELVRLWANRNPAVEWALEWKEFEILVWADNIFLVTSSASEAKRRTQEMASVIEKKKLVFNHSSLEILPTGAAEKDKIPIVLEDKKEFSWVHTLLVLACFIDSTGSTEAQIRGRLFQVRKIFNKLRPMLCYPQFPEQERISAFCTTLGTTVLWGSGCWTPSVNAQQLVSAQENRWLRCVLGGRKKSDMEWAESLRESIRAAHSLRCKLGIPALWHKAMAAIHGWAGHMDRRPHPGAAAVQWRDAKWWEIMKSTGSGSPDQTWRHPKKNWVRGFENALVKRQPPKPAEPKAGVHQRSYTLLEWAKVGQTKREDHTASSCYQRVDLV